MRAGLFGLVRNSFVSLSSIFTMVVTLCVITSLMFGSAILNTTLNVLRDKVDLNIYFIPDAEEVDVLAMKSTLEALPEVSLVEYISEDQVLENFRKKHENNQSNLQALEELGFNPFGATLNVKTKEPSQYEGVAKFLSGDSALSSSGKVIIDDVNYFQNKTAIDRLTSIIETSKKIGFLATILLVVISVLITLNTIRLVIFMSRDEIAVMRLVGASSFYVRGPFVVTGILYGLAAGLITLILFYPVTLYLGSFSQGFFVGLNLFDYFVSNFGQFFLVIMGSGAVIGALSSFLAVRKYLKN